MFKSWELLVGFGAFFVWRMYFTYNLSALSVAVVAAALVVLRVEQKLDLLSERLDEVEKLFAQVREIEVGVAPLVHQSEDRGKKLD